ncbi:DENN domain-containing protein 1C isoform X3 [Ciona intestinalis]
MAKEKHITETSLGSRLRDDATKIFDCFLIVERNAEENGPATELIFPGEFQDKEIIQQSLLFCFPFDSSANGSPLKKNSNHYTFILTDIEGKHRFGFCKLTNNATKCYCLLSFMPWFEIFYKMLNFVCELRTQNQHDALMTMIQNLYNEPVPSPMETFRINETLVFTAPDMTALSSIPENRNLSEYYSNVNTGFMMDMFTSLMFERRVIFTSTNLSTLTSCVHGAEALLRPLHWQHIFIPVMPAHLVDYCLAPMPYLVGVHSSLMPKVRDMIAMDCDIIVADIDKEEIESVHEDMELMPSDVMSFLKSLLRKPTVMVGTNLSMAFLRAQARLIGGYRDGLKFRPGEAIVFDEDAFIESYKTSSGREYARMLVQLQTFKQFVDGRLDMLNEGIGFRDVFENEVNIVDAAKGNSSETYKEWVNAAKKGGNELFMQFKRKAKGNMKAFQNALKQPDKTIISPSKEQKTLEEAPQRIRPSRPPARPPPPDPSKVEELSATRRYRPLNLDDDAISSPDDSAKTERSMSDAFERVEVDLVSDMSVAMDRITSNQTSTVEQPTQPDLLDFNQDVLEITNPVQSEINSTKRSPKPQRNPSLIRRSAHVIARPSLKIKPKLDDVYSSEDLTPSPSDTLDGGVLIGGELTNQKPELFKLTNQNQESSLVDLNLGTTNGKLKATNTTSASADLLGLDLFSSNQPTPMNSNSNNWVQFHDGNPAVPQNTTASIKPQKPTPSVDKLLDMHTAHDAPHKLSPEKLNPFLVSNSSIQQPLTSSNYQSPAFQQNPFYANRFSQYSSMTTTQSVYNPNPIGNSTTSFPTNVNPKPAFNWNRDRPVSKSAIQNRPAQNGNLQRASTVQPRRSNKKGENELFADVLGAWKAREGL